MSIIDVLKDARLRIETGSTWTSGALARNAAGEPCEPTDASACRWDIEGALLAAAGGDDDTAYEAYAVVEQQAPLSLTVTNDRFGWDVIIRVIDRAIRSMVH